MEDNPRPSPKEATTTLPLPEKPADLGRGGVFDFL
jgi:hypothetical protein